LEGNCLIATNAWPAFLGLRRKFSHYWKMEVKNPRSQPHKEAKDAVFGQAAK